MNKKMFVLLIVAIVIIFGLFYLLLFLWKPIHIVYYKHQLQSINPQERLTAANYLLSVKMIEPVYELYERIYATLDVYKRMEIVDELCLLGDEGKYILHDIFRRRCIREMALIPSGEYTMGNENGPKDEQPLHRVIISELLVDRYEAY